MVKLSSRDIGLLLGSLILSSIPVGYLQVVLPLYLNRAGLEPGLIGLLYSMSGIVTAILVAFSGVLADRFGRRRFLILGTALPIISYAIFGLTTDSAWLLVASVLGGVGLANGAAGAMTAASFDALLAEHTPPHQRTAVFSWSQALWSVALSLGSLGAALPVLLRDVFGMNELDSYRPPFATVIVLALLATVVLLPLSERSVSAHPDVERTGWFPRRSLPVIGRYSIALGMFGLGLGIAVQLLPLWFKLRFDVDEAALGPWYAASQMLSLGSVVLSLWLDRKLGTAISVMLVQVAGSLCLLLTALVVPTFELAALAFMGRNVLANLAWPLQQSLLMTRVVPAERASAAGVAFAVWGLTNAFGPALGGAMLQAGALSLPLVLGGVAYGLGGLAFGVGFATLGGQLPSVLKEDSDHDGR